MADRLELVGGFGLIVGGILAIVGVWTGLRSRRHKVPSARVIARQNGS
ncbi:MAG: hypothetical protein AB7P03_00440 [Kofleriaceae bacterium]